MSALDDERIQWMRQRVSLTLDVPTDVFDEHFAVAVNATVVLDFMSKKYTSGSILLMSCERWTEERVVEEVINEEDPTEKVESTEVNPSDEANVDPQPSVAAEEEKGDIDAPEAPKTVSRIEIVSRVKLLVGMNRLAPEVQERLSVYFVRSLDGDVPKKGAMSSSQFSSAMVDSFEFIVMAGDPLFCVANTMKKLYLPVIERGLAEYSGLPDLDEGLKHELTSNLSKFEQQLRLTTSTRGDNKLYVPNIVISNPEAVVDDYETVVQIEAAIKDWTAHMQAAVEHEHQKVSRHGSPLSEIEFWRERSTSLSTVYEQLTTPKAQQMIQVLKLMENQNLVLFQFNFSELSKLYLEAKDNVKFLSTLERHFKHIEKGTFNTILDNMPSLLNGLRMVWVISRHYNTDERMAPLLSNIADTIYRRVKDEVKLSIMLALDYNTARVKIQLAKDVLQEWSDRYYAVRAKMEKSESEHRWNFDRKELFLKTDYSKEICQDMLEIVEAIDHFRKFLGPELKAVTGDSAGIDQVLQRVESLTLPLKFQQEEKIFELSFEKTWEAIMKKFRSSVVEIEKLTELFIKESFTKLRSAEGAFDLVQNFQKISAGGTGGALSQQINDRYNDILTQYLHELSAVSGLFSAQKDRPPLYKNYPPVAGAIAWARDLYQRAKRPIVRFRKHGGMLDDKFGEEVKERYLIFARSVDAYINDLYNDWEAGVSSTVADKLRQPVLRSIASYSVPAKNDKGPVDFVLPPPPYRVCFAYELKMIIRESRYLDKLGFHIPDPALNVTLQDVKYQDNIRQLNRKLQDFDRVLASLKPIERQLLSSHIEDLNSAVKVGFTPLNWTSQRIPAYIDDLDKAIENFSSTVSLVQKNSTMIEDIVKKIGETLLVQGKDVRLLHEGFKPMDIAEFFEVMDAKRASRLEGLVHEYTSIGDTFLMKVEEVVCKTATGCSPGLSSYYHHWEKHVYNAIAEMIIGSISVLLGMLECKDTGPLFRLQVSLSGKELVVTPSTNDVEKFIGKSVKNVTESAKAFVRWMHGTCLKCDPVTVSDEDEPFIYSFYDDIKQNPIIVNLTHSVNQHTASVISMSNRYLEGWRRYDKVNGLWNPKRKQEIERQRTDAAMTANLEQAMHFYQSIRQTVESQPTFKNMDFLHMDVHAVAVGIAKQAEIWKEDYGESLHASSFGLLSKLTDRISALESNLMSETNDLDQLKFVLNVIHDIAAVSPDMDLDLLDVSERYRTLARYGVNVPQTETQSAMTLDKRWHKLFCDSKTRDLRLTDTKLLFRQVTAQQDVEFRELLVTLRREFEESGPGTPNINLDTGVELLGDYKERLMRLNKQKADLVNAQNLFGLDVKPYPDLNNTCSKVEVLDKIYDLYIAFRDFQNTMASTMWADLDIQVLQKGTTNFENMCRRYADLQENPTFRAVEGRIQNSKEALPLVFSLKNDAMKTRHWTKVMDVTGVAFDVTLRSLTLSNIFAMELHRFSAAIEEIVVEAIQEGKIEADLEKIEAQWRRTSLQITKYKKDGQDRGFVLRAADDLKTELEDNMLNLQSIASSRYVGAFLDRVRKWSDTLNLVSECLEEWFIVQRKWIYLEGIFVGAEDIRMQLPEEAKKFDVIDKLFKGVMAVVNKNPNVIDACVNDNRKEMLVALSQRLDGCQKSLSDYLDTKRAAFPRFFFISDDELLSVLGSSDPTTIQVHLLKLFDNVKEMAFGRNNKVVEGMSSVEKEGFSMKTSVNVEGPVEVWMLAAESEMHVTLRDTTKEGVFVYAAHERTAWLGLVLGMVGLVGSQIWWTWEVEDAFRQVYAGNKYAMKELEAKLTRQLVDLVTLVRQPLDKILRKKVNTLLIIDVHARDIVDGFVRESVLNAKEFAWESQLRFYWDKALDDCVIKQCTGKFRYGYEYMGLNGRLVITPLTDRCYMTLTQALTFKLGGSPAGPAGTGKTETTKDLAKSLALPCFVINCGDGLDYKAMASIFSGLVQVGAWGCFDEFNRINIEVLSVVSAQLKSIQNALIHDKPTCDIGIGGEMLIKRVAGFATCGFFITMNPGYAGRTELPDNLKALFRPVTMIVPDLQQICEIMLFSEGFEGAKVLAKKMTVLYKLSKEQLSKQFHYDFGLRALKSVLVMAGGLKRQYSDMSEDMVLMRCLRDSNAPKFIFEDLPLFLGLISDLFTGLDCPRVGFEDLKEAAMHDLEQRGYKCSNAQVFSDQVDKVIQMHETMIVRHTTMIVGPTGGGKTLVLETLKNASKESLNIDVKMFVLNPKAQPLKELYGIMDPVTRDWTDGILSKLFREVNERLPAGKENEMRWIVYDGDVDALWVENMNSVMDDNKLLTLPNGERIRLEPHCSMICETFDLQYASPATISRCGMVWVDPQNLGYRPYYERWVRSKCGDSVVIEEERQADADTLTNLYEKYVPRCVDMILTGVVDGEMGQKLEQVVPITSIDMVKQLCSCLDSFLPPDMSNLTDVESIYIFCVVWSLGAQLLGDSRIKFDAYVKKLSREMLPEGLLYNFYYDLKSMKWEPWKVPDYVEPSPFKFYEVVVPTTDSVLYSHLLASLAPLRPILFIGESGTAKTTIIQKYLAGLPTTSYTRLNVNFSSRTTAADMQSNIEANVDKRSGQIYGPSSGRKLIVFLDDVNMPKVDTYGTQQPIALLLFLMSRGCVYDRSKDLNPKYIRDMQYVAACGPPGGGRNPLDPRFVALFNVFNLTEPTLAVLDRIYSSIISQRFTQFAPAVKDSASGITTCILRLFSFIVAAMPRTPTKFHYIFNLRDLSRVYEGISNVTSDVLESKELLVRLFKHECDRVFGDRLINEEDRTTYTTEMRAILKANYPDCVDKAMVEPILFGDFERSVERLSTGNDSEDARLYRDMGGYEWVRSIFGNVLELYNQERPPMSLVLFEQALEHLCRIHRIIRCSRGNALLVGVGGSGKQSLTTLATFCAGYKLFQISLSRGYGEEQFKEELKELYRQLGAGEVVFLFTDAHVVEEGFLEFINNMLTTGMVPSLYAQDERDALCSTVRAEVKQLGMPETPDNLWSYYVNKCRNNLHIVLAMSPSGSKLRLRCRNFPGMVSNTVIDWFFPWPNDALEKVAEFFLKGEPLPEEHKKSVVSHLVFAHQSVSSAAIKFEEALRRKYFVTPKNYLDFIRNYKLQLKENHKRINTSVKRLAGGLQKLIEAAESVDRMQVILTEKKVVVDDKTEKVQALISIIQEKSSVASEQQAEATKKQKAAEEAAVVIAREKETADEKLMEALPAVAAAEEALKNLNRDDLTNLKAYNNPPLPVKLLMYQLICLKPTGEKLAEDWNDAKKLLSNMGLLDSLRKYAKDDITEKMAKKVYGYLKENPDELNMDKMKSVSTAAAGIFSWVTAVLKYYEVAKNVNPLRAKVKEMEKAQRLMEAELATVRSTLAQLEIEIAELNANFTEASAELDQLQQEASLMSKRLDAASKLITGLGGERTRWSADVEHLNKQASLLIGDCLIGSSFLSYVGAFTTDYRKELLFDKFLPDVLARGIPMSHPFSLEGLLTTDSTIQGWVSKGLPADDHSIQNGILTTKSSRFPLCIDPQQQAVSWIKRTYATQNLTVKLMSDGDFMKHLELAIQFGNPFLFENIDEELDPMIDPILEKNLVTEGSQQLIKLGDKMVEWDDNFRLFFTTKLANPVYTPEVMGKTMVINYGVTMDGLANQLLNVVVAHERPDLEKQWAALVSSMGENAQLLVSLEDTLLLELSSSTGNILDNQELIATLENTKQKAVEIQKKLQQANETKVDIGVARSVYKPVAKRGSILYFAEAGLATLSSMYEISLDSFLGVFKGALSQAKKDVVLEHRLKNMIDMSTRQVYDYTCIGIFEKHKLMFAFQMTNAVLDGDGLLDKPVLDFFLKGDTSLDVVAVACPAPWLIGSGWKDLFYLRSIRPVFAEIVSDFIANTAMWKAWYDLEAPELESFPNGFHEKLTALERLTVMRCFRPDRVYNSVKMYVIETMGEKYVQPPVLDYARIFQQSLPTMPMVFILSPGADPQSDIQKFCGEMGMQNRFKFVALGQGQGPIAEQLLEAGRSRGHWILLQNCHLLASWLKTLEKMLNDSKEPHKDFRLWLTTEPSDKFPLGILQRSLKIVTEPPDGLKPNMRATYSRVDNAMFTECPHWAFRPCLYVLTFLHAVVLERRKYGKIGWNVSYDFNESDFNISRRLLSLYLQKAFEDGDEFLPWGSLKYLIGDAMYGGRVSDDMDRRILKTYLEEYMGDFLFDDCQKFSFSRVGFDYELPAFGELDNYVNMVESLPLTNSPAVFGLHPNAEIGYYTNAVKAMWLDLISLQPRGAGGGEGVSREAYIGTIAKDIFAKLPLKSLDVGSFDLLQTRELLLRKNRSQIISPCQVVLLQELERWNNLVKRMAVTLMDLQRALIGEIGMSDDLDALGDSLYNGFLPQAWRRLAPDTQKPLSSWMLHFLKRFEQYSTWIAQGEPAAMWLSGLHIPESYLSALVQTTCRKRGWPLDKSTLYTVVTKHTSSAGLEALESGCYISGLYLEGGSWDEETSSLRSQDPKVLVVQLPIMQIIPVEASKLKLHGTFRTPVYVTQARRNAMGVGLVFEADLSTDQHSSHWVLQGVSLCLNVDT